MRILGGELVSGAALQLDSGASLEVRIEDPGKAFPIKEDRVDAPPVSCGVVSSNGAYIRAKLAGFDASGRTYQVAIPTGQAVQLLLSSRLARFFDTTATPLSFPHATLAVASQAKGAAVRIVVTAQALTASEKEQVRFR